MNREEVKQNPNGTSQSSEPSGTANSRYFEPKLKMFI